MPDNRISQVNHEVFGWDFQYVAALYLFVDDLSCYQAIGFEKKEDIVLLRKDGKYDYAQAKAAYVSDEIKLKSHYSEIVKSLKTLSNKQLENSNTLTCIFNFSNPYGEDSKDFYSTSIFNILKYDELPTLVKNTLNDKMMAKSITIDTDKLYFKYLKCSPGEYKKELNEKIKEKLAYISDTAVAKSNRILDRWFYLLHENGHQRYDLVDTEIFMGTLFDILLDKSSDFQKVIEDYGIDCGYNDDDYENSLIDYFDKKASSVVTYFNIVGGFYNFLEDNKLKSLSSKQKLVAYLNSITENDIPLDFKNNFNYSCNILVLYKLLCCYVIRKKDNLKSISEVFGYDNK